MKVESPPAASTDTVRRYWFDRDHGHAVSRFFSSDWTRNVLTCLVVLVAVWSLTLSSRNQERAIQAQFDAQTKQIKFQSEVAANQTWERYRQIALQYRDLNRGNVDYDRLNDDQKAVYQLLVERLLMAADLIAITAPGDNEWQAAFQIEFLKHRDYLLSNDFLYGPNQPVSEYCTYRKDARAWLVFTFKSEKGEPLKAAEQNCIRMGFTD